MDSLPALRVFQNEDAESQTIFGGFGEQKSLPCELYTLEYNRKSDPDWICAT